MEYITSRPFATRQPTAAISGAGFPGGCGDVPPLPMPLFIQMKPLTALTWAFGEAFKCALKGGCNEKNPEWFSPASYLAITEMCVCQQTPAESGTED